MYWNYSILKGQNTTPDWWEMLTHCGYHMILLYIIVNRVTIIYVVLGCYIFQVIIIRIDIEIYQQSLSFMVACIAA